MRLVIACVGRAKTAEQDLCDEYLKRARALGAKLGFSRIDLAVADTARLATAPARMKQEAEKLTARLPAGAHLVLDLRGPCAAPTRSCRPFTRPAGRAA